MDYVIPVVPPHMEPKKYNTPISEKENLLRALRHEKPLWMPIQSQNTQWIYPPAHRDASGDPKGEKGGGYDWFGTWYEYSKEQQGYTPMPGVLEEITEWREKVKWPDLSKVDWLEGMEGFQRAEDKALATRFPSGCHERLIAFEGFEQDLCDLAEEPEECAAFFKRHGKYREDCIRYMQDAYHFDYIVNHDDWAHAKAQFFTLNTFENTILEPTIGVAKAAHDSGALFVEHCCGKMDVFVPYLVKDIHVDVLEIQSIVDIRKILDEYGADVTVSYSIDPDIMYNPETKVSEVRAYARELVDTFGAQTCDGAGIILSMRGNNPETYYAFMDEIYEYSGEKYAGI